MSSFDPVLDRGKQYVLDNEQELNAAGVSEDRIRKIKANAIMLDELSRREWDDYLKRRNEIFEKSDATGHAYLRAVREASKSIRSEFAKRKFVEQEGPRVQAVKLHDMYRNGFNAEFGSEHLVRREFEKREEVFQPGVLTEMMREMSNFDVFAEALGIGMQREPKLENESDAEHMKRVADEHTLFAVGMKFLSQNRLERDTFRNKFGLTETAGGEAILERLLDRHPVLKERFSTEEQFKDTVRFLQARHHYMQLAAGLDEAAVELSKANDETYTDSRESLLLILDGAWNELKALKEKMPDGFIEKEIGPAAQRASGVSRAGKDVFDLPVRPALFDKPGMGNSLRWLAAMGLRTAYGLTAGLLPEQERFRTGAAIEAITPRISESKTLAEDIAEVEAGGERKKVFGDKPATRLLKKVVPAVGAPDEIISGVLKFRENVPFGKQISDLPLHFIPTSKQSAIEEVASLAAFTGRASAIGKSGVDRLADRAVGKVFGNRLKRPVQEITREAIRIGGAAGTDPEIPVEDLTGRVEALASGMILGAPFGAIGARRVSLQRKARIERIAEAQARKISREFRRGQQEFEAGVLERRDFRRKIASDATQIRSKFRERVFQEKVDERILKELTEGSESILGGQRLQRILTANKLFKNRDIGLATYRAAIKKLSPEIAGDVFPRDLPGRPTGRQLPPGTTEARPGRKPRRVGGRTIFRGDKGVLTVRRTEGANTFEIISGVKTRERTGVVKKRRRKGEKVPKGKPESPVARVKGRKPIEAIESGFVSAEEAFQRAAVLSGSAPKPKFTRQGQRTRIDGKSGTVFVVPSRGNPGKFDLLFAVRGQEKTRSRVATGLDKELARSRGAEFATFGRLVLPRIPKEVVKGKPIPPHVPKKRPIPGPHSELKFTPPFATIPGRQAPRAAPPSPPKPASPPKPTSPSPSGTFTVKPKTKPGVKPKPKQKRKLSPVFGVPLKKLSPDDIAKMSKPKLRKALNEAKESGDKLTVVQIQRRMAEVPPIRLHRLAELSMEDRIKKIKGYSDKTLEQLSKYLRDIDSLVAHRNRKDTITMISEGADLLKRGKLKDSAASSAEGLIKPPPAPKPPKGGPATISGEMGLARTRADIPGLTKDPVNLIRSIASRNKEWAGDPHAIVTKDKLLQLPGTGVTLHPNVFGISHSRRANLKTNARFPIDLKSFESVWKRRAELKKLSKKELVDLASKRGIEGGEKIRTKGDLAEAIIRAETSGRGGVVERIKGSDRFGLTLKDPPAPKPPPSPRKRPPPSEGGEGGGGTKPKPKPKPPKPKPPKSKAKPKPKPKPEPAVGQEPPPPITAKSFKKQKADLNDSIQWARREVGIWSRSLSEGAATKKRNAQKYLDELLRARDDLLLAGEAFRPDVFPKPPKPKPPKSKTKPKPKPKRSRREARGLRVLARAARGEKDVQDFINKATAYTNENPRGPEIGAIFDSQGRHLADPVRASQNSLDFSVARGAAKGGTMVHTHPSIRSFSPSDLMSAARMGLKNQVVITNGRAFSVSGFENMTAAEVNNFVRRLTVKTVELREKNKKRFLKRLIREGKAHEAITRGGSIPVGNFVKELTKTAASLSNKLEFQSRRLGSKEPLQLRFPELPDDIARFPIEPIKTNVPGPTRREIHAAINHAGGTTVRILAMGRNILGRFVPGTGSIAVKFGKIPVMLHEVTHKLEQAGGFSRNLRKKFPKIMDELDRPEFSHTITRPGRRHADIERTAEFGRAYFLNPKYARQMAPQFAKKWEEFLGKEALRDWSKVTEMIQKVEGQDPIFRGSSTVVYPPELTKITFFDNMLNKLRGRGREDHLKPPDLLPIPRISKIREKFQSSHEGIRVAEEFYEKATGSKIRESRRPMARMIDAITFRSTTGSMAETGLMNSAGQRIKVLRFETGEAPLKDKAADIKRRTTVLNAEFIMEPLKRLLIEGVHDAMTYLRAIDSVLISVRGIHERAAKGRAGNITGSGMGLRAEALIERDVVRVLKGELPSTVLSQTEIKLVAEAARRYRVLMAETLKRTADSGIFSEAQLQKMLARKDVYANLTRWMAVAPEQLVAPVLANPKKAFKGTASYDPQSPYLSAWAVVAALERQATNNWLVRSVAALAEPKANPKGFSDFHRIGDIVVNPDQIGATRFMVDGKVRAVLFDPYIKRTFDRMAAIEADIPVMRYAAAPAQILRNTVTKTPDFALRNFIRDFQDSLIKSADPRIIPTNPFGAFRVSRREMDEFLSRGGGQFGWYANTPPDWAKWTIATMERMQAEGGRFLSPQTFSGPGAKRFWARYERLLSGSELAPKVAEYKRLRDRQIGKGMNELDAHYYALIRSRRLTDFQQVGSWMRIPSQIQPFLNAGIQGVYSSLSAAKARPGVTAARGFLMAAGLVALEEGHARMFGDINMLRNLPPWRRDLFLSFYMGNGEHLSIPVGWIAGLFRSITRRLWEYGITKDPLVWEGFSDSAYRSLVPVEVFKSKQGAPLPIPDPVPLLGPLGTSLAGLKYNTDFFGRDIIPWWEIERSLDLREGAERASRLGHGISWLWNKMPGLEADPRQVDFIIENQFGLAGQQLRGIIDIGREDRQGPRFVGIKRVTPSTTPAIRKATEDLKRRGLENKREARAFRDLGSRIFRERDPKEKQRLLEKRDRAARKLLERIKAFDRAKR